MEKTASGIARVAVHGGNGVLDNKGPVSGVNGVLDSQGAYCLEKSASAIAKGAVPGGIGVWDSQGGSTWRNRRLG